MHTNDRPMSELIKAVDTGRVQLPDFQRGWVWSDTKIKKLIASVTNDYPISAAMFLSFGGNQLRFKYRPVEGAKNVTDAPPDELILDGQQRLTAIYQAMYSEEPVDTKTDNGRKTQRYYYIHIPDAVKGTEREGAIISVPADRIVRTNFNSNSVRDLSTPEKEYEQRMFPVNLMFDMRKACKWQNEYYKYHNSDNQVIDEYITFVEDVLFPTNGYQMPVILLDKDISKEAICQVFENVNTGGVPLTVFELVTAIFATDDFELRKDWDKRKATHFTGDILQDTVTATDFLTACTLLSAHKKGGTVSCKKKDVLNLSLDDYKRYADDLTSGFVEAEKILQENRIFSSKDLPYSTQLIPLSVLCTLLLDKNQIKTTAIKEKIEKWLWCGVFGELYSGTIETRFVWDVTGFMRWVNDNNSVPKTVSESYFNPTRLLTLQSRQSAAYKGIMALILKNKAKDFISGRDMDFASYKAENIDIHHVFPRKYCEGKRYSREKWNSVLNKTPIGYSTNRTIGAVAPSEYLAKIVAKGLVASQKLDSYLKTHLLNVDAMKTDDFDAFIIERAKKLLDAISKATGNPIDGRDSKDVIEAFGASLK